MTIRRTLGPTILLVAFGVMLAAGLAAGQADPSAAQPVQSTANLIAVADATLRSGQPDANFGSENPLEVSYNDFEGVSEAVTLLRFDLTSLPSDAIIDSAVLELYLASSSGVSPVGIAAFFVTSSWLENSMTWNSFLSVNPTGIISQVDGSTGGYKSWDITSYAQSWHSGMSNYGVFLRGPTDGTDYGRNFESREPAANPPRLVVTYHQPTLTPTITPTSTNTPTATATSTPTATPTPTSTNTPTSTPASSATETPTPIERRFQGQVYFGYPGNTDEALANAQVSLYGSGSPQNRGASGEPLATAVTDGSGSYDLFFEILPEQDYLTYTLRVEDPSGNLLGMGALEGSVPADPTFEAQTGSLSFGQIPASTYTGVNFWMLNATIVPPPSLPILFILVETSPDEHDIHHPDHPPALFRELLSGGGRNLVDYFLENSNDNLRLSPASEGDLDGTADGILGWYTLDPGEEEIIKRRQRALQEADQDFDFSLYDTKPPQGTITTDELLVVVVVAQAGGNEHTCELRDKKKFDSNTFQRVTRTSGGLDYEVIQGKLNGESGYTDYQFRYWAWSHPTRDVWARGDAYNNCVNHGQTLESGYPKWYPATGGGTVRSINAVSTDDGVTIGGGFQVAAIDQWTSFITYPHEISHILSPQWGLDLYNLKGNGSQGFALMGATIDVPGSFHHDPWNKTKLGWITPTVVTAPGWHTLPDIETSGQVLKVMAGGRSSEFFLVENRWKGTSYDMNATAPSDIPGLPGNGIPDEGLAIWHIDESRIQAYHGEDFKTPHFLDKEDAGAAANTALWDGTKSFHQLSNPDSDWNDGTASDIVVTCISPPGPTMSVYIDFTSEATGFDDRYEPNNEKAYATVIAAGSYNDLSLHAVCDKDFYTWVTSDYTDVSVTVQAFSDPGFEQPATGPDLTLWRGDQVVTTGQGSLQKNFVPPGTLYLEIDASVRLYYHFQIDITNSIIAPDRFDDQLPVPEPRNDTFTDRAVITTVVQDRGPLGGWDAIADLNFDVISDTDFFEVTLAPETDPTTGQGECLSPGTPPYGEPTFHQGRLVIWAAPDSWNPATEGYNLPFEVKLYDADGNVIPGYEPESGFSLEIECPHEVFGEAGIVRFSIRAKDGKRNFYRVFLIYNRWYDISPPGGVPPWVLTLTDPPLIRVIPPIEKLIPWFFPSDPEVIDLALAGNPPDPLPAEYAVFGWEAGDLELLLSTEANNQMTLTLFDADQQIVAATEVGGLRANRGSGSILVTDLVTGTYVLAFQSEDFGTVYSVSAGAPGAVCPEETCRTFLPLILRHSGPGIRGSISSPPWREALLGAEAGHPTPITRSKFPR